MSSSSPQDFVSLPEDILTPIFRFLNQTDRCSISYTCRFLRDISRPTRFRDVEIKSERALYRLHDLIHQEDFVHLVNIVQEMTLRDWYLLSIPIPQLFPSLASLSVRCPNNSSLFPIASLNEVVADPSFSALKLTSLSIIIEEYRGENTIPFIRQILSGETRKSIVSLEIHAGIDPRDASWHRRYLTSLDPFLQSTETFPSLRNLDLSGVSLSKLELARFPTLFPALSSLHCLSMPSSETPLHDGNAEPFEALEDLCILYSSRFEINERIFGHAVHLKKVDLRGLTNKSAFKALRNIAAAKMTASNLTSVSIEMVLFSINDIVREDIDIDAEVLERAFCAMKNLEHFALVGHANVERVPFGWCCPEERFASMLSNTRSLRTLRTNMTLDMLLPNCYDEVILYVQSARNFKRYVDLTRRFISECPSLEVVTWGFRKGTEGWLHIPIRGLSEKGLGGADRVNIDEIYLSKRAVYSRPAPSRPAVYSRPAPSPFTIVPRRVRYRDQY